VHPTRKGADANMLELATCTYLVKLILIEGRERGVALRGFRRRLGSRSTQPATSPHHQRGVLQLGAGDSRPATRGWLEFVDE
jgi:hypothetical protein